MCVSGILTRTRSDSDVSTLTVDDSIADPMAAFAATITDASSSSSNSCTSTNFDSSMSSLDSQNSDVKFGQHRQQQAQSEFHAANNSTKKRVVILNANHTGLLAAIYLMRRPGHSVTILSPTVDIGLLSRDELSRNRGTQVGLSDSGLAAIQAIPELWERYIRPFEMEAMDFVPDDMAANGARMTIDENYLCWALSKYLADNFTNKAGVNYFLSHMDKDPNAQEDQTANDFTAYYNVVTKQMGGPKGGNKNGKATTTRRRRSTGRKSSSEATGEESKKAVLFRHWYEDEDDAVKTVEYDLLMQ